MNNKKPQIKELLKVKVFQIAYIHNIVYSMSIYKEKPGFRNFSFDE